LRAAFLLRLCFDFVERRLDIDFVNEHFGSFLFVGLFLFYRFFAQVSVDLFMMFFWLGGYQWIDTELVFALHKLQGVT
jgi:hypothetical protein